MLRIIFWQIHRLTATSSRIMHVYQNGFRSTPRGTRWEAGEMPCHEGRRDKKPGENLPRKVTRRKARGIPLAKPIFATSQGSPPLGNHFFATFPGYLTPGKPPFSPFPRGPRRRKLALRPSLFRPCTLALDFHSHLRLLAFSQGPRRRTPAPTSSDPAHAPLPTFPVSIFPTLFSSSKIHPVPIIGKILVGKIKCRYR